MTASDRPAFIEALKELTLGFNRPTSDLTEQRVLALFDHFAHVNIGVWQRAVKRMLIGGRYPSIADMERCVDDANEHERRTINERRDFEAKDFFDKGPRRLENEREYLGDIGGPRLVSAIRAFHDRLAQGFSLVESVEAFKHVGDDANEGTAEFFIDYATAYGRLPFNIGARDREQRASEALDAVERAREVGQ